MNNWKSVHLQEVASVFNGKTPSMSEHRSEGHPVLKIKDVDEYGSFRGAYESFVDPDLAAVYADRFIHDGDTLILNAAHNASYVGSKTYRAQAQVVGALATGEWLVIRPDRDLLDVGYVHHWVNTPQTRRELRNVVKGIHLYPKDVSRLAVALPPLDEQRRIADVLDRAEALRAKRREAIAHLDALTQSIFLDMFGDPVVNPKGWPEGRRLGDVADIVSGITKGRKLNAAATREVPYLAVVNVQDRRLDLTMVKTIEATEAEVDRYRLREGDLVLTEGGDPDKLGRGALWADEIPDCIHQNHIFRVRLVDADLTPVYLSWLVGSQRGKRYFLKSAKQTTGIATINSQQLRAFPLLIPPVPLQNEFAAAIDRVAVLREQMKASLQSFDACFASLQHRAFGGEL